MKDEQLRNRAILLCNEIDSGYPLGELLTKGRFLDTDTHARESGDGNAGHLYYKILETYDKRTNTVLLSKKGSRISMDNLDIPGKRFTLGELRDKFWFVRPADYKLF